MAAGAGLRPRLMAILIMLLLGAAGYGLFTRTPRGIALAAGLAVLVALAARAGRRPVRLIHNALGVAWTHPERGGGAMAYREVGAMIIRDDWGGERIALFLVPRGLSDSHAGQFRPANSFVLTGADLGGDPAEQEEGVKAFAASVLPRLPTDITLDRGTRRRLEAWGLLPPEPHG